MKSSLKKLFFTPSTRALGVAATSLVFGVLSSQATVYNFTNTAGTNEYTTGGNWSGGVLPNTANGDTANIANGSAVTYTPGGDLTIANGGILQVTSGSFTQVVGNNYIQLNGNGTIRVNGGTFNQGTASSTPFNVTGTGNLFAVSSGAVNINSSFNLNVGLSYTQTGGTVIVTGAETDFNSTTNTLSGGTLSTKLITGVNGPGSSIFNVSGGTLNLSGSAFNGIYAGGVTQYLNFTPGSTGKITFSSGSTTTTDVQNFINAGVIEYNGGGTGTLSNFVITSNAGVVTLSLPAVPEPSTVALSLLGALGVMGWTLRRKRTA